MPTLPPTSLKLYRPVWAVCCGKVPVPGWSTATHAFCPPRFKAAVQQLLFVAAAQQRRAGAGPPLQPALLPSLAFARVLQLAFAPLGDWL